MVNPFDAGILHLVNQFAQRSWLLDKSVVFISEDPFTAGGIATTFFWWAWFRKSDQQTKQRKVILSGLALSFIALFVARGLALLLPFRVRPFLVTELGFRPPFGANEYYQDLIHWSAFPSDHAVLYFSLATCILLVSRNAGILAYSHAFFVVCMPRIYLGEHYPTDILAGAVLGIGISSLCMNKKLQDMIADRPLRLLDASPAAFYACFYLCTFLFATNFNSVRKAVLQTLHQIAFSGRSLF